MRCPKCGAFLEEGRTNCFMCGTDLTSVGNNQNNNNQFISNNNNQNQFNNVNVTKSPQQDKDMFDFFQEHKKGIKVFILLIILAVGGFIGYKIYNNKKNPEIKPVLKDLYFQIADGFENVTNSQNTLVYTKTGQKGIACSISVATGSDTDGNHVKTFFDMMYQNLLPKQKNEEEPIDVKDQIEKKENVFNQKGTTWHNMNIYYRNENNLEFTDLRYQYLTAIYKGYYYNIELINYSKDAACTNALNTFIKSLEFIN